MAIERLLRLALFSAALSVVAGSVGCKDKPPTSTAPPTLTNINRENLGGGETSDDEEYLDDDELDEPVGRPRFRPMTRGSSNLKTPSGKKPGRPAHTGRKAATINGHPQGPKAEVFNAVINSAFPRASRCFARQTGRLKPGRNTLKIQISVSREGSVESARVTSGISNEDVRSCVTRVMRSLKFPSYEGKEISQSIPLTYVAK
jgi:outer membrane biosynthesis protein TonB